ncbi:hypothetical protein ABBQ38_007165 [Trebouxia sp. C0009 RCD-2024]
MVAKQQEVIDRLRSSVRSTRLKAVRDIKNQIIGNKNKKLSYVRLQAVPLVVELLRETADPHLLVQTAAAVGSFAYGLEDGLRAVVASGGVQHLLQAVSLHDDKVQEAALRALKLVWQSPGAAQLHQLDGQNLERIVSLLSPSHQSTSEIATQVLAEYCQWAQPDVVSRLAQDPCIGTSLMQLIISERAGREAAAAALALLTSRSSSMATACTHVPQCQSALMGLLKHPAPATRLAACICLQNICSVADADESSDGNSESAYRAMLPVLLKLLHMPTVLEQVPQVLTDLLQRSPAMQKAANDSDAVSSLTTILHHEHTWHNRPRFKEGVLRALSILCRDHVDARWNVVQRASLAQIAKALEDPDIKVCTAACACIQSLSGSMKCLRELPLAQLTPSAVRLLSHAQPEVQLTALKALTNLLLDADTVKSCVALQSDGLPNIVKMLSAADADARCSAMWALSHLVHNAKPAVCEAVMAALPWEQFSPLLQDPDSTVQERSFMMLRNMAACSVWHRSSEPVQHSTKTWSQATTVPVLVARLQAAPQPPEQVLMHILKTLANFAATGGEAYRDAVTNMAKECINAHLQHEGVEIRTAALWVIINLTDRDEHEPGGEVKRIQQFQSIGVEARLREMLQDVSYDVRERATSALGNFDYGHTENDGEMSFEPVHLMEVPVDGS